MTAIDQIADSLAPILGASASERLATPPSVPPLVQKNITDMFRKPFVQELILKELAKATPKPTAPADAKPKAPRKKKEVGKTVEIKS